MPRSCDIVLCHHFDFCARGGRTVTGQVVDQNNDPLIGAGVVVEGQSAIGAVTDFDGNYSLTVPEDATQLRFSYIGMADQVVDIAGRTVINVTLAEDANLLEGVVVTALGIKRSEKAVTYNVQKVDEKVFVTREANMVNSLAGKLAGVQINETSAGAGSESKVVMRGAKSIQNSNNALYVLDGIPLPTLSTTMPGDSYEILSSWNRSGDGMAMLNSEDVADMSALVGPSAAALYGYKAANGILMLTTRGGEEGVHVSYSNSTTFSTPFMLPRLQSTYGSKLGQYSSWGNRLNVAPAWSINDFFQTGVNQSHTVSLSMGGENYSTYVSAGWNGADGIIPNNKYGRFNVTAHQTVDFLQNRLHLSLLGMYMKVDEQNMLSGGLYHNPLVPVYLMSPGDNLYAYAVYERYNPQRNFPTQFWSANEMSMQNPFWLVNRNLFNTGKNRFLAGGSLSFDITDWLDIQARVRTDYNATIAEQKFYASSNGLFAGEYGRYYYDDMKTRQTYGDVLLNVHKTFGENLFQLNAVLGASIEDYFYRGTAIGGDLLGVANLFTFNNMETGKAFDKETYRDQVQSVFGTAQLGLKNMIFLDVTARNDWASQLARSDGRVTPIFYPSVGLSVILTDLFKVNSDFLTFAKIRGSYAEVGNPIWTIR
ncbi:MAG: SusC/RagA family TonB-linked outer membrane protein [Bacteroidales bacterium]|nr:SusC/RagA family TonB-linked outer membrane protein [Bacteroidales bacterium]